MGASPSQHLASGAPEQPTNVQWPLQDDMGVVIALPSPPPLKQSITQHQQQHIAGDLVGKRVLVVQAGSPAAQAGLVPWLDYVVGLDGRYFKGGENEGITMGMETGKKHKFQVFNCKTNSIRECAILPTKKPEGQLFLGLKISAWQTPDVECLDKVIRVMYVARRSPAFEAGLEQESDYILGTCEHGAFTTLDDLEFVVTDYEGKVLELYIYNTARDDVRIATVRPRAGWSSEGGLLGAELANGILHRIPQSSRRTSAKDRATAGEQSLAERDTVRTPEGFGELMETHSDGSSTVKLDWGLGNDVSVIGKFTAKNLDVAGS